MSETEPKPTDPFENIVIPPKKKRARPPRFTTREQIIARIDKFATKAKRQRDSQKECYLKAAQLRRHSPEEKDDEVSFKMKNLNVLGDRWGRKADRLEKDVLPTLRQKLAEFDTEVLPGVVTDKSVEGI